MVDDRWSLYARLRQLHAARVGVDLQRAALLEETGQVARALVDRGESRRSVAQGAGLTHPTVAALMTPGARRALPGERIPVLRLSEVLGEVLSHFDASDVWLAFNPGDFLAELELSPAMFAIGQAGRLPPALLRSVQGEWLGISDCLCGYGGSGPHNTVELLAALGLDRETVAPIVFSSRFVHLDVGREELVKRASDPLTHLPAYAYVTDDTVIVPLKDRSSGASRSWLRWEPRAGDHTFERERNGEGNTLKDWCEELLCRDPPPWATPPPRARIYTSRDTAQQAGLERQGESFTLIVEQGDLQLWCAAGSLGAGKLPHEVITEALAIVGLKEPRLTRRLRQPAYVEVGGPLRCEPSELAVALRGDG